MKKVKFILIGAGDRGTTYVSRGAESCPEMEVVAVADPDPIRRNYIRDKFSIPEEKIFRPAAWNAFGMDKEGQDYRGCQTYGPMYK